MGRNDVRMSTDPVIRWWNYGWFPLFLWVFQRYKDECAFLCIMKSFCVCEWYWNLRSQAHWAHHWATPWPGGLWKKSHCAGLWKVQVIALQSWLNPWGAEHKDWPSQQLGSPVLSKVTLSGSGTETRATSLQLWFCWSSPLAWLIVSLLHRYSQLLKERLPDKLFS